MEMILFLGLAWFAQSCNSAKVTSISRDARAPVESLLSTVAKVGLGVLPGTLGVSSASASASVVLSTGSSSGMPLGEGAFTEIAGMPTCRILNGMWQLSGAHGYTPVKEDAVAQMAAFAGKIPAYFPCVLLCVLTNFFFCDRAAEKGFTTFDLADIYGPAEDFVGAFRAGRLASTAAKQCQFFTKVIRFRCFYKVTVSIIMVPSMV